MIKKQIQTTLFSIVGILILLTSVQGVQAQNQPSKEDVRNLIKTITESSKEESRINKLLADLVRPSYDKATVDSMLLQMELDREDEIFPADELYDSWNTEYVKAYAGVDIPSEFKIDVSGFIMPVEGKITSNYGPRRRRFHYGTDLKLQVGDTVYAAFDGKVRVKQYERKGYGYYLVLRHPNGLETVYGHLSKFLVEQDEQVQAGQPIALGGNTGRSTGSHLHFEFRFLGQAINPGEIIDFEELCTKDDFYVFKKSESGKAYNSSSGRYLAGSSGKIHYHRVRSGDTLYSIARKNGTTINKICKLNNIKPTTTLRVGKSLRLS
ncbi:peptidase [Bacteroidia bacterium]|nr:peptidase [Bacteroidia bacterium]